MTTITKIWFILKTNISKIPIMTNEEMEADRKEKERQISKLKNVVKYLNEKVETMERSLD